MSKIKTYNISDTANGALDSAALHAEMLANATLNAIFDGINRIQGETAFDCVLLVDRTTEIDSAMDAVVAAHTGKPLDKTESVRVSEAPAPNPFASKIIGDKGIFQRVHGESYALSSGSNVIDHSVPYPQIKFNEIEIIGGELGDTCNLKILDTSTGTYTTIANYQLNQFGFNVNVKPDYYQRSSNYDADLFQGMRVYIEYASVSAKTVYINYILHELK